MKIQNGQYRPFCIFKQWTNLFILGIKDNDLEDIFRNVEEKARVSELYFKAVDITNLSTKDIGNLGEKVAAEYARRQGMKVVARNVTRKTGEIDIVARKDNCLHFIEVKSILCVQFPDDSLNADRYDPSANLHEAKIRRVARTSEWYVMNVDWEGEWQVDAVLVWLRKRDGRAKVRYLPQIL